MTFAHGGHTFVMRSDCWVCVRCGHLSRRPLEYPPTCRQDTPTTVGSL